MAIDQINELQLVIEDQNRQIAELSKKLGTALEQNSDLRSLFSEQRQREFTLLAQLHDETVRANKAEKSNKSSELRKARHEQEERANAAESQAAQLEQENLELQVKLLDEIEAKKNLIQQLKQIEALTSTRTTRKLLESKNKRIAELGNRAKVAEALAVSQKDEIEYYLQSIDKLWKKIEKFESQLMTSDIKRIFAGFGVDIVGNLDKGERMDLYNAVEKAKKLDNSTKDADKAKKETDGYKARIRKVLAEILETRDSEIAKQIITEQTIIDVVESEKEKPNPFKAFNKCSTPVKLAFAAGVIAFVGVILVAALVPTLSKANQEAQNADIQARLATLEAQYGEAIATIINSYGTVYGNQDLAALLQDNITEENVDEFNTIAQATELANNLVIFNGGNEISAESIDEVSAVGQNVKAYLEAKKSGDVETAQECLTALTEQMEEIRSAANNSSTAVNGILQGLGIQNVDDLDEFLRWQELVSQPVVDIQVTDAQLAEYGDSLISQGAMFGGYLKDVKFVRYEKETGKVTIFADCESNYGNDYVNVITFNTDKNQNNVTFEGIMTRAHELANSGKLMSNAALADTVIEDANGNTAYTVVSSTYDKKTDSTTVTTHLLVLTADNNYRDFVETTTYEGRLKGDSLTDAKDANADRTMMRANKAMGTELNRFNEVDLDIDE